MRVKLFLLAGLLAISSFYACNDSDEFKKSDTGLEYKIITEGTGDSTLSVGQIAVLELKYFTSKDSLLFDSKESPTKFMLKVEKPSHQGGSIEEGFTLMKVGDSTQFLISADSFFIKTRGIKTPMFIEDGEKLRFDVKIISTITEEEIQAERMKLDQEKQLEEQKIINDYIATNNITVEPTQSGLYIIPIEKGNGKKVEAGQVAVVHYTGTLTNGQVFDSSVQRDEPFEFPLGQHRVIQAWDEAVATMRVGDKIKIVSPSNLAYGSRGAGGMIAPFSTLVFEIKLIGIK